MSEIASKQQLRLSFLRWAVVTVPLILLLGFGSARLAPVGAENVWYAALRKPAGTPPDWLFPVAWTTIYILMGLALAMVIHARGARWRGTAISVFVVQLLVNLAWSPLFFGMHRITAAQALIVVLFVLATLTTVLFGRVRTLAAWLLVPYLAWLVVAGLLAHGIGVLNPDAENLVPSAGSTQIIPA